MCVCVCVRASAIFVCFSFTIFRKLRFSTSSEYFEVAGLAILRTYFVRVFVVYTCTKFCVYHTVRHPRCVFINCVGFINCRTQLSGGRYMLFIT